MLPRCSLCPCTKGRNPILPWLPPNLPPPPVPVLFIGEAGAKWEDAAGIPFVGQTGQELDGQYLPLAGLSRDSVPICNAVYCSQLSYRNPKDKEAAACSGKHLPALLSRLQPKVIVTMGAIAASLFPGINLNLHHGIPQKGRYGDWEGIIYPSYHPSAGLRSTQYMIPLREDFKNLGKLLRELEHGKFEWPHDPIPKPDYQVINNRFDLGLYLDIRVVEPAHWFTDISFDTEFSSSGPYCLTFSHTPGTGRLIYAADRDLICDLDAYLEFTRPHLFHLHNAMADLDPLYSMGIIIPPHRFLDTMIRSYELGLGGGGDEDDSGGRGSLGLKSLAYRHLHMPMQSFKDLVTPYAIPLVIEYLERVRNLSAPIAPEIVCANCGCPQNTHSTSKSGKHTGPCLLCASRPCRRFKKLTVARGNSQQTKELGLLHRKVNTLISKLEDEIFDVDRKTDPWKRVEEWHGWEREWMGERVGAMPIRDITMVPEPALVGYACKDADATIRLAYFLNRYKTS